MRTPPTVIAQDNMETIAIELRGYNMTTAILQLAVQVMSLPSHGTLYASNNGTKIEVDSIFPFSGNATGISVMYKLDSTEYFNVPETNAHGADLHLPLEAFNFRIVSINALTMKVVDASETMPVPVHVVHVNRGAPTLTAPKEAVPSVFDSSKANVIGIEVADLLDFNLDRVRVDVWSEGGTVSLNPSHLHLADFATCASRSLSPWQCVGDGFKDQRLTFVAIPDDISFILSNMVFESFAHADEAGEIGIRIYDGAGGDCLHETEHAAYRQVSFGDIYTSEHHNKCIAVQATIVVPSKGPGGRTILGFTWKEFAFGVTSITLILLCICGHFCNFSRCFVRSKSVTPDTDGSLRSGENQV